MQLYALIESTEDTEKLPNSDKIELLVKLLKTVGQMLDSEPKDKALIDSYFLYLSSPHSIIESCYLFAGLTITFSFLLFFY
jgi:hypothetical protein